MLKSFIKNPDLIAESSNVDDLFDFSKAITNFSNRLDSLEESAIIGLIGPFGSGKSTMLYQIQKIRESRESKEDWINFDAWKYPERRDLWEGFILEIAEQVKDLNSILSKIEGKDITSKLLDVSGGIAGTVIPGIGKLFEVLKSPPAKRVFQLQQILTEMLNKMSKRVYVVVEDIDRSGDAGIYFLETLKQFLVKANLSTQVLVIVPISDKIFEEYKDSYHKCLDYNEEYTPKFDSFQNFVETIFDETLFQGGYEKGKEDNQQLTPKAVKKGQIISFLGELHRRHSIDIRQIKSLLRKANKNFGLQSDAELFPDWRFTIAFEAAKYIPTSDNDAPSQFHKINKTKEISSSTIISALLHSTHLGNDSIFDPRKDNKNLNFPPQAIKIVKRERPDDLKNFPSWLKIYEQEYEDFKRRSFFGVCDFYLDF